MSKKSIKFLKEALQIHEIALESLRLKAAYYGPLNVPEHILSEITEREKEIRKLRKEIKIAISLSKKKIKVTTIISDKEISKVPSKREVSLVESVKEIVEKTKRLKERFTKEATFLDIDVVGSTKLKQGEEDIDIIYSFNEYHRYIKEKVETFNGKVLNSVGDEVMAIFDIPEDALKAGIEIFRGRDEFNKRRNELKKDFQFRIGINTGVALVDKDKAYSNVLDIAGHLQKEANLGEILISEKTYIAISEKDKYPLSKRYIEEDKIWAYVYKKRLTASELLIEHLQRFRKGETGFFVSVDPFDWKEVLKHFADVEDSELVNNVTQVAIDTYNTAFERLEKQGVITEGTPATPQGIERMAEEMLNILQKRKTFSEELSGSGDKRENKVGNGQSVDILIQHLQRFLRGETAFFMSNYIGDWHEELKDFLKNTNLIEEVGQLAIRTYNEVLKQGVLKEGDLATSETMRKIAEGMLNILQKQKGR